MSKSSNMTDEEREARKATLLKKWTSEKVAADLKAYEERLKDLEIPRELYPERFLSSKPTPFLEYSDKTR